MTYLLGDDERVQVTISIGRATENFLAELQEAGYATTRSGAVELAIEHFRAHLADDELAAAAAGVDPQAERCAPGVIGASPRDGRHDQTPDADQPPWSLAGDTDTDR